jgi:Zn-dependent peptidase ImmA (M78 family)
VAFALGFKKLCEIIASEIRGELGLREIDPLDPHAVATHLAIPVASFSGLVKLGASSAAVDALTRPDSPISAFTFYAGTRKLIFYNDAHARTRTASSLAHELAHVILEHEPASEVVPVRGQPTWNADLEAEAHWLGATLLVPRCAALSWLKAGGTIWKGADHFGVSDELFRWRVDHTGVATQMRHRSRALARTAR